MPSSKGGDQLSLAVFYWLERSLLNYLIYTGHMTGIRRLRQATLKGIHPPKDSLFFSV